MTVGKVTTPSGETIEIDTSGMEERMAKKVKENVQQYMDELKEWKAKNKEGKGVIDVTERLGSQAAKVVEELRDISNWPSSKRALQEQWTITIPNYTSKEVAGHLRDYVWTSDIIKGAKGDHVHIPYVKDFDFQVLGTIGTAFAAQTTGLVNILQATLTEAGAWSDIMYSDIERIDANLLDELNRTFAHAAVRAEDKVLIELISACTATNFAGQVDRKTGGQIFYATNIPSAIGLLITQGKEVHPGDCVIYMTGTAYARLLQELTGTAATAVAYARSDIMQKGIVEEFCGVRIVVGGEVETETRTTSTTTGTCHMAYLFRAKRCLALAPKRDILIETDRQIATRKLRITGSHTFATKLLDAKEAVRIWCNTKSGT